jgi:dGTPase
MFTVDDIATVPLVGGIVAAIRLEYPGLETERLVHELVRRLIGAMVEDVIAETQRRLDATKPQSAQDVRRAEHPVVGFSPAMAQTDAAIKSFLYPRMYRHARIERVMSEAEQVVRDLFDHYRRQPEDMPGEWSAEAADDHARVRGIADYIGGMTDRYALIEHARFFRKTPELL